MPVIETLLQHALLDESIYVHHPWKAFKKSKRPVLDKSWDAWIHAYAALYHADLGSTLNWLQTASKILVNHPNDLCEAEVLTSWSILWDEADEPRSALDYAYAAWKKWFAMASNPLATLDLKSIRALLRVLASPEKPPPLNDEELFLIWLSDRLALQFHNAASTVISLCGRLGIREPATEVEKQIWEWLDQYLHGDHIAKGLSVFPYADLLNDVANLYDQLGEYDRALETYKKAIALLEDAIDHPDVHRLRTMLCCNMGNQFAKLGEHREAIGIFAEAQKDFQSQGNNEGVLQAKHAQMVSHWYIQELSGLKEDLEALLVDYETYYKACKSTSQQIVTRQNLDAAYRLWLALIAAEEGKDERLVQRFLGQLYALREGFVQFSLNWASIADLGSEVSVVSEIDVLVSRLARLEGVVLLVLESGIERTILTTIKSGESGLVDRVHIELGSDAFTLALTSLLESYRQVTDKLIIREMAMKSLPSENFEQACRDIWREMPESIRRDLTEAQTILVSPSNVGNMDEIPVELFHDESEYLGLTKNIVRVISLGQLHAILSDNWINIRPYSKGLILRAGEVVDASPLSQADSEVKEVKASMEALVGEVCILCEPIKEEMLADLDSGVDVMHYVGHGFADENGEALILSDEEDVTALELLSAGAARAPVSVISACLVGRVRHLRTGKQRGITTVLLDQGAPAVVAPSYALPDQVGKEFSLTLYAYGYDANLSDAMRLTRQYLAEQEYHPAVWGAFIMLGHPDATLKGVLSSAGGDLAWPVSLCRFITTGAQTYLDMTRQQLHADSRLSKEQIEKVNAALSAFSSGEASFFDPERLKQSIGLQVIDTEAYLAYSILLNIGSLRFSATGNNGEIREQQADLTGSLLSIQRLLNDSYILVALFVEITKRTMYSLAKEEERSLLRRTARALDWLNADDLLLKEAHQTLAFWNERLKSSVFIDVQNLTGVDTETWTQADAGDRQALKLMLRNLGIQRASIAAITSTLPWTDWMLRMIGCGGTPQALSDLLGVINESQKKGRLSETEAEALYRTLEQYFGPGEVDEATARTVRDTFSQRLPERDVLDLFLLHDQLASGEKGIPLSEVQRAMRLARELGSLGSEMYFTGIWCQRAASLGALEPAVGTLWSVLKNYEDLAARDGEYADRIGITALVLRQLCQHLNDGEAIARIDTRYMGAIQAHLSQSS